VKIEVICFVPDNNMKFFYRNIKKSEEFLAIYTEKRYIWRKITSMSKQEEITISQWIENLQSRGRYAFSLDLLARELPAYTEIAVRSALNRLTAKGRIISIYKRYFLIIPPQYLSKGILPPALFLDGLMRNLERPYYLALLNAAGFYGASHQQPQEFFVVTNLPFLRIAPKKGVKINFLSKKVIPEKLLESKKTETGYLKVSNPVLTACDLILYEKRVGGINRVSTVLNELAEVIKPEMFSSDLFEYVPVATLQRLGYILEKVLGYDSLANALYVIFEQKNLNLFRTPLKASSPEVGFPLDERWKIIVNTVIEIDD
jgi:Predicted transcriptional regulator